MSEENYNKSSVALRRVKPDPEGPKREPGDFFWDFDADYLGGKREDAQHYLYVCLPGEDHCNPISVQRGGAPGNRVWGWNGDEHKPTVEPSIHYVGRWHGWLRVGQLTSV